MCKIVNGKADQIDETVQKMTMLQRRQYCSFPTKKNQIFQ
jgi:hypothetical protein